MNRSKIYVLPLWNEERNQKSLPRYLNLVENAGAEAIVIKEGNYDHLAMAARDGDGFLFTGGPDIDPEIYGQEKMPVCDVVNNPRDDFEKRLFELVAGKPMLGVCRGFQLINALLGGTLYQDIPSQTQTTLTHRQQEPFDAPAHQVRLMPDSPLHRELGDDIIGVNSLHHQGVSRLAPGLLPMAVAEDGLIEGYFCASKPIIAVQWHPELMPNSDSSKALLKAFLHQCKVHE